MNPEPFHEEVVIAGFGGQGVVLLGKLLATAGMRAGYEVTYMPSYGAEVRGGTANSMIVLADRPIASPLVITPDSLIAMNAASLEKFAPRVKQNGLLVLNSSLVTQRPERSDLAVTELPAEEIALELGAPKAANMVALGAYITLRSLLSVQQVGDCLQEVLAPRYHKTIPINRQALEAGERFVREKCPTMQKA